MSVRLQLLGHDGCGDRPLGLILRPVKYAPTLALLCLALCACDSGQQAPLTEPTFPGLTADVEVVIDDRGIPHIYGATDADVLYASGYQMATDRLFQMDLIRRRALGKLAEVFGGDRRDDDETARLFGFARWGLEDAHRMQRDSPADYALTVAWTAGLNARIDEVRRGAAPLPYGFGPSELDYQPEPWTVADGFAIGKMLAFANSNSLEREVLASVLERDFPTVSASVEIIRPLFDAYPIPPEDRPAPLSAPLPPVARPTPPVHVAPADLRSALSTLHSRLAPFTVLGSNNWAVSGRFTANGRPLIANDPHQPLQSPSVMYMQHLNSTERGSGSLDVIGWSFAGTPGVQLGHNQHIHWAATTNFADVMDVWDVSTTPDGAQAQVGTTMEPIVARDELIKIRAPGMPAGVGTDFHYTVSEVPGRGVLLPRNIVPIPVGRPGRLLLFQWAGFRGTNEARCFLTLDRAQNIDDFERAVDLMEVGGFNFVGADANQIAYRVHVLVPDRGPPAGRPDPWKLLDGDDASTLWTGAWLPPEKLPHSRAPVQGWIATANNDPYGFTGNGRTDDDPWYYGAFYTPGARGKRIEDELTRLAARGSISVADMQALQVDTHSTVADLLLPLLEAAHGRVGTDASLAEFMGRTDLDDLVTRLTAWDRRMERDSADAVVFHGFIHFLAARVLGDDLDFIFDLALQASSVYVLKIAALAMTGVYPHGDGVLQEGRDVLAMRALSDAAEWITTKFGGLEATRYRWGDVHGTAFENSFGGMLDGGWVSTDGGEDTVNVSGSRFFNSSGVRPRFESHDGPVFRVVTSFADDGTPESVANTVRGESADPASPHFADETSNWLEDVYTPVAYRRAEVDAATERSYTLTK